MGSARQPIAVIQNWMDPLTKDDAVREWADDHGALYTSYSTLGGQWQWRDSTAGGAERNPVLAHPTVQRIAAKHGVSPVLTVLSWALQLRVAIIPRSSNPKHIQELAQALLPDAGGVVQTFLDEEDMAAMGAMEAEWEAGGHGMGAADAVGEEDGGDAPGSEEL